MREKTIAVASVVFVVALIGISLLYAYGTKDTVVARVTKTERVTTGSGDNIRSVYLVFSDGEVFANQDSVLYWKFNSSDIHGRLEPGTYTLQVYGWRVPILSWYRNIVSVENKS